MGSCKKHREEVLIHLMPCVHLTGCDFPPRTACIWRPPQRRTPALSRGGPACLQHAAATPLGQGAPAAVLPEGTRGQIAKPSKCAVQQE